MKGLGGTKTFVQMVGSGSLTLHKGKNEKGVLKSENVEHLSVLAQSVARNHDVASLQQKLIRNMGRIKEWDGQGYFNIWKVYRVDFNPSMEIHLVRMRNPLLPPDSIDKQLLAAT